MASVAGAVGLLAVRCGKERILGRCPALLDMADAAGNIAPICRGIFVVAQGTRGLAVACVGKGDVKERRACLYRDWLLGRLIGRMTWTAVGKELGIGRTLRSVVVVTTVTGMIALLGVKSIV